MADCAVHRHVRDEASAQPGSNAQENGLAQPSNEALGEAFVQNIALFSALIELEQEVMRERDRLIQQYERRSAIVKAYEDAVAPVVQNRYEPADG